MLCALGSAAIEMFPYHFDHTLYSAIAQMAGVGMFPVHSINGTSTYREDDVSLCARGRSASVRTWAFCSLAILRLWTASCSGYPKLLPPVHRRAARWRRRAIGNLTRTQRARVCECACAHVRCAHGRGQAYMNSDKRCPELSGLNVNLFWECRQHAIEWGLWINLQVGRAGASCPPPPNPHPHPYPSLVHPTVCAQT